jgi:iron complex outermembrane receptor protein
MVEYEHREQSGSLYRATQKGAEWDFWQSVFPTMSMPKDNRNISSNQGLSEEDDSNIWTYGLQLDYDLGFATHVETRQGPRRLREDRRDADRFQRLRAVRKDAEQELRRLAKYRCISWYAGASFKRRSV